MEAHSTHTKIRLFSILHRTHGHSLVIHSSSSSKASAACPPELFNFSQTRKFETSALHASAVVVLAVVDVVVHIHLLYCVYFCRATKKESVDARYQAPGRYHTTYSICDEFVSTLICSTIRSGRIQNTPTGVNILVGTADDNGQMISTKCSPTLQ